MMQSLFVGHDSRRLGMKVHEGKLKKPKLFAQEESVWSCNPSGRIKTNEDVIWKLGLGPWKLVM